MVFHSIFFGFQPTPIQPPQVSCVTSSNRSSNEKRGTMSCMPTAPPLPRTTAAATLGLGMADAWRIIPVVS